MKSIIVLLIFLSNLNFAQSDEFKLYNTGYDDMVYSMVEDTSGNIWAAVSNKIVLISETIIDTLIIPTDFVIWAMDVDQQNNLWIATQDTGLIKYDGFTLEYFDIRQIITRTPNRNNANCVQVDIDNNVWIGAIGGLAKYDRNEWTAYNDLNTPLQYLPDIYTIKFDSQNNLWFGYEYGAGRFDGANWTLWNSYPFNIYCYSVAVSNTGSVWFGPSWGNYVEMINDTSFIQYNNFLSLYYSTHSIAIDKNNNIWLGIILSDTLTLAYNGLEFKSLDIPFTEVQSFTLKSIYADKQNNKWFGFVNGYIVKYTGDFPTNIEDEVANIPSEFILYQNYPNPFNPSTKISWQSHVGGWQTLKVYDVLGNEVATLVDEYRPAGIYDVQFTMNNLSSGIYFYQIKVDSFIETKKMIILK